MTNATIVAERFVNEACYAACADAPRWEKIGFKVLRRCALSTLCISPSRAPGEVGRVNSASQADGADRYRLAAMITDTITELLAVHDLPEPAPLDPMPLLVKWWQEAEVSGKYDDPNAMSLATATPTGSPSVRIVLCKGISSEDGSVVFYTNYNSRKGLELERNPQAAAVFHWPHAKRQARVEGLVEKLTIAESDAYFKGRPLLSRIGAVISRQSTPIESRTKLVEAIIAVAKSAATGHEINRPTDWGGYRIRLKSVELWSGRNGRLHQRILWRRDSTDRSSPWTSTLLAP